MKKFIITIDTEGDNLWSYHKGDEIKTQNALFIPRFQEVCEKYGFKPVYLTNYEMICSNDFTEYIRPKAQTGLCEVGIHLHAWNTPPYYDLGDQKNDCPYLIEYPYEIMRQKFQATYNLIKENIGIAPVSHRAGRWAMNDDYFKLLAEFGIKVDCSHVPGANMYNSWGAKIPGPDYTNVSRNPSVINGVLEVPVNTHKFYHFASGSWKQRIRTMINGDNVWARPSTHSTWCINKLLNWASHNDGNDFIIFMMHSSEFMPGGSPYFKDKESIEKMYKSIDEIFSFAIKLGYHGCTLADYAQQYSK